MADRAAGPAGFATSGAEARALARKVLQTEAAAILALVDRLADREHDRGARDRRRAGDDAARRERLPRGGFREPAPGREAREAADAGRAPDARRQAVPDRHRGYADARRHLRDVEQRSGDDVRS